MWYLIEPVAEYWVLTTAITLIGTVISQGRIHPQYISGFSMVVAIFLFLPRYQKGYRYQEKAACRKNAKKLPLWILFGAGISVFLNMVVTFLQIGQNAKGFLENQALQYSVPFFFGLLLYGVIAPISEELVFRAFLYTRLRGKYKVLPAVIISALVFGIYHGNIIQGVYAVLMGSLFALAYEKTGTIVTPVLMHCVANLLSFSISYLGG